MTAPGGTMAALRTRRGKVASALGLAIALLVTVLVLLHLDSEYGPIEGGSFIGPYSMSGLTATGANGAVLSLASEPGATARLITSLDNRGAHSVTVTGIDDVGFIAAISWSTYQVVPGGDVTGLKTPWHSFPAVVPAHGTIRLLVTIHRPSQLCSDIPADIGGGSFTGALRVHLRTLLHRRTILIPGEDFWQIKVC